MKATIIDVAEEAGVSLGTVSKVINNKHVKASTKRAVDSAIKKLNYKPNIYARGMRTKNTETIAIIVPTIWHPFFSEFVYYVEKNLSKIGKKLLICNSEGKYEKEMEYINMVNQHKVDGIIAITYSDIDKYINTNIPFVSIDRFFTENVNYIMSDNYEGGRIAARKLIECGCRNIAFVESRSQIKSDTMDRRRGFIYECEKLNTEYKIFEFNDHSYGFENFLDDFINENYKNSIEIDGIFAGNDIIAYRIIEKLKKINIDIPNDVQIIGFDGSRPCSEISEGISSIRQDVELMAKKSVQALIGSINEKGNVVRSVLPVNFKKGYTTKK